MELPLPFVTRMQTLLDTSYPAFASALSKPPVRALRVNTAKISVADFQKICPFPLTPLPFTTEGFLCEAEKVGALPAHHAGMFYMQDPSAMATVCACPPKPGAMVLDLCAAPGGKSTQLAALVGERGFVLSNEYHAGRCRILAGNLERMGCTNTAVTNTDAAHLAAWYPETFDYVLVDAPCSGEGMFRKYPQACTEWSEENVRMCATRQAQILADAAKTVKAGGYLIYSTCTFAVEEDEAQVDAFLHAHPDFILRPVTDAVRSHTADGIALPGPHAQALLQTRRFYPHLCAGEGQFIAVLQRTRETGDGENPHASRKDALEKPDRGTAGLLQSFLQDLFSESIAMEPFCLAERLFLLPPHRLPLPAKETMAAGVPLGILQKGRIVPHHALYMAFGRQMRRQIELSAQEPLLLAYLRGEEIPAPGAADGYTAVLYHGVPLGGGKVSGGRLKNHYPKGLRLLKN